MNVAIDAMGGDLAPSEVIKGTCESAKKIPDLRHILVGKKELIGNDYGLSNIEFENATDVIGMDDSPVDALRKKQDSSIMKCVSLVENNKAKAVVSAGNTGALFVAARFKLGLIEGVKRPAIALSFPTEKGHALLIDAGANVNSKASHLLQFAIMGSVYTKLINPSIGNPSIGLLNIGEEPKKGSRTMRLAYKLFKSFDINFAGNAEGHTIFSGKYDIIVCDGFIGNILLKSSEGMINFFAKSLIATDPSLAPIVGAVAKKFDWQEFGGAPLLGVNGIVIICHGRSGSRAIQNAIGLAHTLAEKDINTHMSSELKKVTLWKRVSSWFHRVKEKEEEE